MSLGDKPPLMSFISAIPKAFHEGDRDAAAKRVEFQNVRLVEEVYRLIAIGEFDALVAHLDESIAFEIVGPVSLPSQAAHGLEQVIGDVKRNFSAVESHETEVESLLAQGDAVIMVARDKGVYRENQAPYHVQFFVQFRFRDGKIHHIREWVLPLA